MLLLLKFVIKIFALKNFKINNHQKLYTQHNTCNNLAWVIQGLLDDLDTTLVSEVYISTSIYSFYSINSFKSHENRLKLTENISE